MSDPTPGPYTVAGSNATGVFVVTPPTPTHPDGLIVAIAPGPHRGIIDAETRATADLLSASWEMLVAMECQEAWLHVTDGGMDQLLETLKRYGWDDSRENCLQFMARIWHEALAKARGRKLEEVTT